MPKINPFKPNSPAPTGMFAGRYNEIIDLERGLFQTKNNQPANFIITGERGIGKSSLLLLSKHLSTGNVPSVQHGSFNFVSINISISEKLDILSLIKLLERNISRELEKIETIRSFLQETWAFVQRLKIMDSSISPAERDSEVELQLDNFAYSLAETCKRIVNPERDEKKKDGILFLLDECDSASGDLRLGYFFKSVTEALQRHNCHNIMFVVAGLPGTSEKLSKSHASSMRIFSLMRILELSFKESHYVINKGIEEENKINCDKTSITTEASDLIASLSEGYPHFIQQFSYSAFQFDSNGEISSDDVMDATFHPAGAIDAIGSRYYETAFYEKIKSDEYRQVLEIMAEKMSAWVTKSEIRVKFTGDESTLSNALQALTSRKIILRNPTKMGEYRLQQRGFAIWIKLFGDRVKNRRK